MPSGPPLGLLERMLQAKQKGPLNRRDIDEVWKNVQIKGRNKSVDAMPIVPHPRGIVSIDECLYPASSFPGVTRLR